MSAKRSTVHVLPSAHNALQRLVSTDKAAADKRRRAPILCKAHPGPQGLAWTEQQMGAAFAVGRMTVARPRRAFVLESLHAA